MSKEITPSETVGIDPERLNRIRPRMETYITEDKLAGISVMVARKGKIVLNEQVGWQDKESQTPMRDDTIFRIYSMTKPVICTALMTLYEQGRFHLYHPISKYIPAFKSSKILEDMDGGVQKLTPAEREITIRDLLTHTAGLSYDFLVDFPIGKLYRDSRLLNDAGRSLEEMVHELARLPIAFQPGSQWHYSLSIDVIAHLIEVLSDKPLAQYLRETLFDPLGMEDTDFHIPPEKLNRCSSIYGTRDLCGKDITFSVIDQTWGIEKPQKLDVSETYPTDQPGHFARGGIGLFSTIGDFMRFAQLLLDKGTWDGKQILSRKTLDLMHTNHLPQALLPYKMYDMSMWSGFGFGLGSRVLLDVAQSEILGSIGEFGWAGAANTHYWVDPQEELIGILMSQYLIGENAPEEDFQVLTYQALVD